MERNIMDEFTDLINLVTLEKAASDKHDHNLKEFAEEKCCCNMRIECYDHFLDNTLMYNLHENLKSRNPNRVYGTVFLIADMAKYDVCRDYLSNIYLVCLLMDRVKRERDYYIRMQTCRALANMCYDHAKTQRLIAGQNPVESIFILLDLSCTPFRRENNKRFKEVIVAFILNLMANQERITKEIAEKYVPNLVRALDSDLKNRIPTAVSHNVFVAIVTLAEVKPPEIIFSMKVCLSVTEMYRRTNIADYPLPGLEFLEDPELPDITKYQLVEAGLFDTFLWILEHKPYEVPEEERKRYELLGRVLSNILSGDEAMSYIFDINNGNVADRLAAWLCRPDKDLIHSGALCLGNIARCDSNSVTIVERGIHKHLIRVVVDYSKDVRILYATVSALRNLCLAKQNKRILIDIGIIDVLLPLLDLEVRTSSPVIYKALGAVRQVIENEKEITINLGTNQSFIRHLVNWSRKTLLPWVSTECTRFLCTLVRTSKNRDVMINMIENHAYDQVVNMLTALHGTVQSEALTCLIITVDAALKEANSEDITELTEEETKKSSLLANFHCILVENRIGEKMQHMIARHGLEMQENVLNEYLTLMENIVDIDPVRIHLYYEGYKGVLTHVLRNRQDFEKNKLRIERIEDACGIF